MARKICNINISPTINIDNSNPSIKFDNSYGNINLSIHNNTNCNIPSRIYPEILNLSLCWLQGDYCDNYMIDSRYNFNFKYLDCTNQPAWSCYYIAPGPNDLGYSQLLQADIDHILYDLSGNPRTLSYVELGFINSDYIFFCAEENKGLIIFNHRLSGIDLYTVETYFGGNCSLSYLIADTGELLTDINNNFFIV